MTEDPTTEGRAGGPSALHGCKESNQALSTMQKAHHLHQASARKVKGPRVSSRSKEEGPHGGQQDGGQASLLATCSLPSLCLSVLSVKWR